MVKSDDVPRPARQARGFNFLARGYDVMEATLAGGVLDRARMAFAGHWPSEGHALIAGEGTGHFLAALRRARPGLRITIIDISPRMLATARRRLERQGLSLDHISFVQGDILTAPLGSYDMIATQFFLDCFNARDLRLMLARLAEAARPGARWFLADFQVPERGFRRARAKILLSLLYRFFRAAAGISASQLEPIVPLLGEHGFTPLEREESDLGFIYAMVLGRDETKPAEGV